MAPGRAGRNIGVAAWLIVVAVGGLALHQWRTGGPQPSGILPQPSRAAAEAELWRRREADFVRKQAELERRIEDLMRSLCGDDAAGCTRQAILRSMRPAEGDHSPGQLRRLFGRRGVAN